MYLAKDYIHEYKGATGARSRCRIRLYLPVEDRDAAVVICSEIANNADASVTDDAEIIAGEVIAYFKIPIPLVWIEHYPSEATPGREETFDLTVFADYVVHRTVRGGGWHREIGPSTRKHLDRETVETLVGQRV